MKRIIALLLLVAMTLGLLAGCGAKTPENKPNEGAQGVDTSETVNLTMYLYGSAGVANQDILDALNEILLKEINATLEIKYIDWGDIATKYPLMWASGEEFDMSYVASNTNTPYALLVNQECLVDITDMLDTVAPTLKAELDQVAWDSMNVNGRIYGVPSTYSEFTAYGFITRGDLLAKYGMDAAAVAAKVRETVAKK
jgi:putative aldouronate transport system substrate-binding protein